MIVMRRAPAYAEPLSIVKLVPEPSFKALKPVPALPIMAPHRSSSMSNRQLIGCLEPTPRDAKKEGVEEDLLIGEGYPLPLEEVCKRSDEVCGAVLCERLYGFKSARSGMCDVQRL